MPLLLEKGGFFVKTVDCADELKASLQLRHDVFHLEHHGRRLPHGYDIDDIDFLCDHLVIVERRSRRLAGSYRLTSSLFSSHFYASKRFELDSFLALPGSKLELGRACVAKEYRNGIVLQLLWRGIGEYIRATGTRYLFGSASVRTQDVHHIRLLYEYLKRGGHLSFDFPVETRSEYRALPKQPLLDYADGQSPTPELDSLGGTLPPLFSSYLKAGARICAEPARDAFLGSADFFTVLDVDAMNGRFDRRYRRAG